MRQQFEMDRFFLYSFIEILVDDAVWNLFACFKGVRRGKPEIELHELSFKRKVGIIRSLQPCEDCYCNLEDIYYIL